MLEPRYENGPSAETFNCDYVMSYFNHDKLSLVRESIKNRIPVQEFAFLLSAHGVNLDNLKITPDLMLSMFMHAGMVIKQNDKFVINPKMISIVERLSNHQRLKLSRDIYIHLNIKHHKKQ